VLVNEIGCRLARTKNEPEKSTVLALSANLAPPNEIAFRDDADKLSGRIDHRKPTDVSLQHDVGSFHDGGLRFDGDNGPGHNLMSAHWCLHTLLFIWLGE
jgi:hypothetical protein